MRFDNAFSVLVTISRLFFLEPNLTLQEEIDFPAPVSLVIVENPSENGLIIFNQRKVFDG
jgi:hypothetical protein